MEDLLGSMGLQLNFYEERRVAGAIRSLVNARSLQLECGKVLHESLLVSVLMYGSDTIIWREKEASMIRPVQMDNRRGLLGINS